MEALKINDYLDDKMKINKGTRIEDMVYMEKDFIIRSFLLSFIKISYL